MIKVRWLAMVSAVTSGLGCLGESSGDLFPPTIQITSPADGATVGGVVNFTVQATDDTGVEVVEFYVGTTKIGEDEITPYSWLWNTTNVTAGQVQLRARVLDLAGNTAEALITVTVSNLPQ